MIWHDRCWLAAECQTCCENNLLINAQLKFIKAQGGENWAFIPQQVPQAHAEQGMETYCDPSGSSSDMLSPCCDI